jgi:glutamate synthase (NADPH/NADH) small chain
MQHSVRKKVCEREPQARNRDFEEVVLGYNEEDAILEAKRCINCKNPKCKAGCPVGIDIPDFLQAIIEKDFLKAFKIIKTKNSLPCITGRVCPQETQCEGACVIGIKGESVAIGNLERFVGDWASKNEIILEKNLENITKKRKKVAIIGSGPAGLACAGECAKMGHDATVFEALHAIGGVLRFGIPKFRLPAEVLEKEISYLKSIGVKFELNFAIGYTLTFQDLKDQGFEAFFIASGAGIPYFLNIPNENLKNIYSANEFLTRINLMNANLFPKYDTPINLGKKAIVIGGGNVAMDSARILVRLGLDEVNVVYRRTMEEMPARKVEILHAEEEGVKFCLLKQSLEFLDDGNGNVHGLKLQNMQLVDSTDGSGRKQVENIEGDISVIDADIVIIAIGQNSNPMIAEKFGLELNHHKHIVVDKDTMETSVQGVFAGGDITTGAATVISAMGAGKKAALAIDKYLN